MMKRLLSLSLLLGLTAMVSAQWVQQATGFAAASRGINHVSVVDQNIVWAAAYDGSGTAATIQEFTRTTNGGTLWTPGTVNGTVGLDMAMIFGINADTAWVPMYHPTGGTTPAQGIYVTHNGGLTWTRQTTATFSASLGSFPNVIHFFDANNGVCQGDPVGGYFEIYTTTDGGTTWTRVPQANIPAPLSGEWGIVGYYDAVGDTIWFGTQKGRVFHSTNKGLNWTVSQTPLTTYTNVYMATGLHGIAQDKGSASTGTMYETFNGGQTWTLINHTGPVYTNDMAHVPGTAETFVSTGAATGLSGCSYSYDGGHTWTDFIGTQGIQFLSTGWADPGNGWAGGFTDQTMPSTVGGMYKYTGILTEVMQQLQKEQGVVVYPNPSEGAFTFALKGFENQEVVLNIRDLSGRSVYSTTKEQSMVTYNIPVDLSHLTAGFYIAELVSGDFSWSQKLVRQ
ncbi:MAG TPA: T9SS type A sorting domain-containing protein [Bacteroidales bacterium]|nr:T9SS type A sorting domain-containing protein [Bacteroidales bacterium]HRZ76924.1 T9SS type A sorting domain-containing protein [Bacteroidales bacterium]